MLMPRVQLGSVDYIKTYFPGLQFFKIFDMQGTIERSSVYFCFYTGNFPCREINQFGPADQQLFFHYREIDEFGCYRQVQL